MKLTYEKASLAAVQKRLEVLGVKGAWAQGDGARVSVFLPGGRRHEEVRRNLSMPGRLELAFVVEGVVKATELSGVELKTDAPMGGTFLAGRAREAVDAALAHAVMPKGRVLVSEDDTEGFRTWVVEAPPAVTGDHLVEAKALDDENIGSIAVAIAFDDTGKAQFADATARGVDRRLAIIVDGNVLSAPVVRERIPGGRANITLGRGATLEDAQVLAAALEGGAFPEAAVLVSEEAYAPRER